MNMKILFLVILNAMITGIYGQAPTSIVINADHIVHEMAGGIGASWHAISISTLSRFELHHDEPGVF